MEEVTPSLEAPENALPSLSDQTNSRPSARPISDAIVQVGYSEPLRGNQPPKAPAMPAPARDATTMSLEAAANAPSPQISQFNWEKFGVADPNKVKPGVRATIKTDGQQ